MNKESIRGTPAAVVESGEHPIRRWFGQWITGFSLYAVLLTLLFVWPLAELVRHAWGDELHSHILLVPLASAYVARDCWRGTSLRTRKSAHAGALVVALVAALWWWLPSRLGSGALSANDRISYLTGLYLLLMVAGGFLFLGSARMRQLAFPVAFLVFMIPLPDFVVSATEEFLMRASADASHALLGLSGTPVYRTGQILELPGAALEVAPECSGIRSTLVLLITTVLASHMFLRSNWHRAILIAVVLPLGVLRNALRVTVLGVLSVHVGPRVLDTWIHHHGGPLFFALSVTPVFGMAAWFRFRERRIRANEASAVR